MRPDERLLSNTTTLTRLVVAVCDPSARLKRTQSSENRNNYAQIILYTEYATDLHAQNRPSKLEAVERVSDYTVAA